jgi:hypothetical protein
MTWSVSRIKGDLQSMTYECCHPRNDGFTQFGIKQDLIEIEFLLKDLLETCPTFAGEEEWLQECLNQRLLKKLGRQREEE